ncbi:PucR family transcriptional regulator [Nocardia sp. CDC159]|uniref:PucR family transcriptional regulator n=1 Tax=Nocardia pulmonis TaxID=2951408 RepID=A0A9X2IZU9_9NOCA|nr:MULTISPECIES: PucR family transcriptional regulator [Nocardia]MCM6776455.1 PucR family transcriptional regulator [Nocardia pulmonis]MCM6788879.1 PucR family transcriptional regulator [Nocardia sp. CDC159]
MQLRDILAEPLGLRLLHGDAAALHRPVTRACVTDMPDPTPFVTPGALVCTGLVWRRDPTDSAPYIGVLARAGAAAVAAGRSLHGHVPDDVIAACRQHDLPLLEAPQTLPFSRLIEHLAARNAETRLRRVKSGLARQRRLLATVAAGGDPNDLLTEFARDEDIAAWLLTGTGAPIAGTAPLTEDQIDTLIGSAAAAPRLPVTLPDGYAVWPVGGRMGDRISLWYLVIRDDAEIDDSGADLAAVAELYRMRHRERLRLRWEIDNPDRIDPLPEGAVAVVVQAVTRSNAGAVEAISHPAESPTEPIDSGTPPLGQQRRAATSDRDPEATTTARGRNGTLSDPDDLRMLVHEILPTARTELDREGRIIAWTTGGEREVADELRRRLGRLRPALRGVRLRVGISSCRSGESVSGTVASAAAAASVPTAEVVSIRIADVDSAVGLLTAVPDGLQRRFAERVLGPIVDYDRRTGAGLLQTLEIFLGCAGSWRQAADRMHLHLNTVRYRIGRVEELTGRDLGRLDDRLDLYLAVRAYTAPV